MKKKVLVLIVWAFVAIGCDAGSRTAVRAMRSCMDICRVRGGGFNFQVGGQQVRSQSYHDVLSDAIEDGQETYLYRAHCDCFFVKDKSPNGSF